MKLKSKIELKNRVFKECMKNDGSEAPFHLPGSFTTEIYSDFSKSKNNNFARLEKELGNSSWFVNPCWSTVKILWNG